MNRTINNEDCKSIPCFVYKLDKPIEYKGGRVFIPIGIQNRADITAYHVQLCQLDDGKFISVSYDKPEHGISEYLEKDNAGKDETIYFVVACDEKVSECEIRFSIQFCNVQGTQYRQNFKILYSADGRFNEGIACFCKNAHYDLPKRMENK